MTIKTDACLFYYLYKRIFAITQHNVLTLTLNTVFFRFYYNINLYVILLFNKINDRRHNVSALNEGEGINFKHVCDLLFNVNTIHLLPKRYFSLKIVQKYARNLSKKFRSLRLI